MTIDHFYILLNLAETIGNLALQNMSLHFMKLSNDRTTKDKIHLIKLTRKTEVAERRTIMSMDVNPMGPPWWIALNLLSTTVDTVTNIANRIPPATTKKTISMCSRSTLIVRGKWERSEKFHGHLRGGTHPKSE